MQRTAVNQALLDLGVVVREIFKRQYGSTPLHDAARRRRDARPRNRYARCAFTLCWIQECCCACLNDGKHLNV